MRIYSLFLPQFHSTPANDEFWGDRFTDWVTTRLAKPLFTGHKQPSRHVYGEYDLDSRNEILRQAKLAASYGINAFGVYHYWFDESSRALEGPINKMMTMKWLPVNYFVCWVNLDWTKSWVGEPGTIIRKQQYTDAFFDKFTDDLVAHFLSQNYEKIDGRPLLYVHRPSDFDFRKFKLLLLSKARNAGFENLLLMSPLDHLSEQDVSEFDYTLGYPPGDYLPWIIRFFSFLRKLLAFPILRYWYNRLLFKYVRVVDFRAYVRGYARFVKRKLKNPKFIPVLLNQWDNTPRYGYNGFVFVNDTPKEQFYLYDNVFALCKSRDFVMIKAWNEWAEGNTLEPCNEYGLKKLEALRTAVEKNIIGSGK